MSFFYKLKLVTKNVFFLYFNFLDTITNLKDNRQSNHPDPRTRNRQENLKGFRKKLSAV